MFVSAAVGSAPLESVLYIAIEKRLRARITGAFDGNRSHTRGPTVEPVPARDYYAMESDTVNAWMRQAYKDAARKYRIHDEIHITGPDHERLKRELRAICESFPYSVSVLDLGCGTGRHFHCLTNLLSLTGVDLSAEMLKEAENPVVGNPPVEAFIRLVCSDIYAVDFESGSFNVIFSLGVFGNGCALTVSFLRRIRRWLRPGGILFLDTADIQTFPRWQRTKKRLRWALYTILPKRAQALWVKTSGWPPLFCCTPEKLARMAKDAGFQNVVVKRVRSHLTQGLGYKLELTAGVLGSLAD